MKYIKKEIKNEPKVLRDYKNSTPSATYDGFIDKDFRTGDRHPLKKALLEEQGYLCAYCMGRISLGLNDKSKPKIEVEHFKPQGKHPELDLDYMNMLGVCNGLSVTYPEKEDVHHCDKTGGGKGKMNGLINLRKLNPHDKSCEKLITYTANGEILAANGDLDIIADLEEVLNLNNKVLRNARKAVIDNARRLLVKEKPTQNWSKKFLKRHLDLWKSKNKKGEYRRYCMIAIWFIEKLLSKPHYK